MTELVRHILAQLYDVRGMIEWGGTAFVCLVIFVETGLFVGFFLPGDSLLVTAGVFAGAGHLKLAWLLSLVTLCAIAGDQLGYLIGWRAGKSSLSAQGFTVLQEAASRAGARILRPKRRKDDYPGALPADRSHVLPPCCGSCQNELWALPYVRHCGGLQLGLGYDAVGLHARPHSPEYGQAHPLHYCCCDCCFVPARRIPRLEISWE